VGQGGCERGGGDGGKKRAAGAWRGRSCLSWVVYVAAAVLADQKATSKREKSAISRSRPDGYSVGQQPQCSRAVAAETNRLTWRRVRFAQGGPARPSACDRGRVSGGSVCSDCQGTLPGACADPDVGVASRRSAGALSEWPCSATQVTVTPPPVSRCTQSRMPVFCTLPGRVGGHDTLTTTPCLTRSPPPTLSGTPRQPARSDTARQGVPAFPALAHRCSCRCAFA
jgi:hypothetical protein